MNIEEYIKKEWTQVCIDNDFNYEVECSVDQIVEIVQEIGCRYCVYFGKERSTIFHCEYFEEFMPLDLGKCDNWESK